MAIFVHIADERHTHSIKKNGLHLSSMYTVSSEIESRGIFAMPVVENFVVTHQWVRELKRQGFRTAVGVYFRISDAEHVWAGQYNQPKISITAAESVATLRQSNQLGFEVVIPRSIQPSEIKYIRHLPQMIGWRYYPDAKGKPPFCGCSYCQRGRIKSRQIRERYEQY